MRLMRQVSPLDMAALLSRKCLEIYYGFHPDIPGRKLHYRADKISLQIRTVS
jgi:hypothetical protein